MFGCACRTAPWILWNCSLAVASENSRLAPNFGIGLMQTLELTYRFLDSQTIEPAPDIPAPCRLCRSTDRVALEDLPVGGGHLLTHRRKGSARTLAWAVGREMERKYATRVTRRTGEIMVYRVS